MKIKKKADISETTVVIIALIILILIVLAIAFSKAEEFKKLLGI